MQKSLRRGFNAFGEGLEQELHRLFPDLASRLADGCQAGCDAVGKGDVVKAYDGKVLGHAVATHS